jgi:hypothetical protein
VSDVIQILKAFVDTPLPSMLVVAGIIFLFFSFADVINIYIIPEYRPWLRLLGIGFLVAGLLLYAVSRMNGSVAPQALLSTTTTTPLATQSATLPFPTSTATTMPTSTATVSPMPTLTGTATLVTPITQPPPVPSPYAGTNYRVQMSTGIISSAQHQAIRTPFSFSGQDRGKNLCVYVESYGHPMRVELWIGIIPIDNLHWWDTYQMLMQDPPGIPWQSKVNPKLAFTVVPGEYTLFVIRWLQEDPTPNIVVDYNISLLSGSCPQNRPW